MVDPAILAAIERNEWLFRCFDVRDEVRRDAPADLSWLGVDRADLRWAAARAFIRGARIAAEAQIDLSLRRVILLDRTAATWKRRGKPGFAPDASDIADAVLAYQRLFKKPAPSLAYTAAASFGPTSSEALLRLAADQGRFDEAVGALESRGAA